MPVFTESGIIFARKQEAGQMSAKIASVLFQVNSSRIPRELIKVGGLGDFVREERRKVSQLIK